MLQPKLNYSFLILVGVLFVLRGLQLQCLYPPLEGPDEYQHIAYLEYLVQEHKIPVYGQAMVPKSLFPDLIANPHCNYDWMQTGQIGCLEYKDFYDRQPIQTGDPNVSLYQAQQAPLYYVLFSPLYSELKAMIGFRGSVYTLRIINVILGAMAVVLLSIPLFGILKDTKSARLGILAISLLPMFMTYVSRVACDPLAVAFAGVAICLLAGISGCKYPVLIAALVGGLIGFGVLTKLLVIALLPASLLYLGYLAVVSKLPRISVLWCILALIGGYLAITLYYHWHSYQQFGTLFPYANSISNAAEGKSAWDLLGHVELIHLRKVFLSMFIRYNLWTSGWSFLLPEKIFTKIFVWTILISLLGLLFAAAGQFRPKSHRGFQGSANFVLCGLVAIFSFLIVYAQILNSIITYGQIVTVSYYVMIGYPAFLSCVLAAAAGFDKKGPSVVAMILIVLFTITEYHSILGKAVWHWAGTESFKLAVERLAGVHPAFPCPGFYPLFAAASCVLTVFLLYTAMVSKDQSCG
jgi:hypothetical protein